MDIIPAEKRSAIMSRIRGRDTEPEKIVRRLLHGMGYRFRTHAVDLPGHPDIVFRSKRAAIFVHGCFWHRHHCGLAYMPKSRRKFWRHKFDKNVARDMEVRKQLQAKGWRVIVVWECQLSHPSLVASRLTRSLGLPRAGRS
jgi:DNA mismatch endonuclease (patch repair protein)